MHWVSWEGTGNTWSTCAQGHVGTHQEINKHSQHNHFVRTTRQDSLTSKKKKHVRNTWREKEKDTLLVNIVLIAYVPLLYLVNLILHGNCAGLPREEQPPCTLRLSGGPGGFSLQNVCGSPAGLNASHRAADFQTSSACHCLCKTRVKPPGLHKLAANS